MREELKKIFRGKLMLCLILLFAAGNMFLLFIQRGKAEVLRMLDEFSAENERVVSEENTEVLADLWNSRNRSDISWEEYARNLEIASHYYSSVTSGEMAGGYCSLMRLEGKAAEFVREQFQKLDSQIEEAASQELTFFPPYRMHIFDFISTYLLFALNLEGILGAVILTLYSLDFERGSHTLMTLYSTRKGKKIIKDKLFAAVAVSLICYLTTTALTLLAAFCMFMSKSVVSALVSNPLVNLKGVPCIANFSMSVGTYILLSLGVSAVLVLIYSLVSFAVGVRMKNGYFAFGVLAAFLGIMKVFSVIAPTSTLMFFWSQYNPIDMAMKAGTWFLYNANNFSPFGYEISTVLLWLAVGSAGCICGLSVLKRKKVEL